MIVESDMSVKTGTRATVRLSKLDQEAIQLISKWLDTRCMIPDLHKASAAVRFALRYTVATLARSEQKKSRRLRALPAAKKDSLVRRL